MGKRPVLAVVLYTRQGCHLCETAAETLRIELVGIDHTLSVHDIDLNPNLLARYTECVPVVVINDKERFLGRVSPVLLRRILQSEGTAAT